MKVRPIATLALVIIPSFALCVSGCSKKETQADATKPLEQSFQSAEPEVVNTIQAVNSSLQSGNYAEAVRTLEPITERPNLTEPQKQAIAVALQQVNQAVIANPSLDTEEMYKLRAKMFDAVDR